MITFKQFLDESINDKGILKAIFVVGLPGAGKSYTVQRLKGAVAPVVINTDRAAEYLARKWGKEITSSTWGDFKDKTHSMTKAQLFNYVNGMLPLFVDGTSNDVSNILHRMGILESLGYDVGVIFVRTDFETALERTKKRAETTGRHVDPEFIAAIHDTNEENKQYLASKVDFFREIDNSGDGAITDALLAKSFSKVQSFFDQPVKNPVGKRLLDKMTSDNEKYLVPSAFTEEALKKKIDGWYRS